MNRLLTITLLAILQPCLGSESPNVIYILADDLGYGDLSTYGQRKFETPTIDALAANGIKFTQHYAGAPVCAPSRTLSPNPNFNFPLKRNAPTSAMAHEKK